MPSEEPSPLEQAVEAEAVSKYYQALGDAQPRDRQLVVARIEAQWSYDEIAEHFGCRRRTPRGWRSRARCVVCWIR